MSHLDILIPFAFPPAAMAADLLRALKTPALSTLIARARKPRSQQCDPFSRALPHESWLARQFGLTGNDSPPVANAAMQAMNLPQNQGHWFLLQPVHIHIARNHLVLTDLRQLALTEQESRALFATAQPLFDEVGKSLLYGDAQTWFMRADDWKDFHTSTPDAACGHNIDIWMPKGDHERDWRKLQNEVQMHWHTHSVNEQRQVRGANPVNSVWLWGGAGSVGIDRTEARRYTDLFHLSGWMQGMALLAGKKSLDASAAAIIGVAPQRGLLVLDALMAPALAEDWSEWITRMQALEDTWFAPMLAALQAGSLSSISLIFTHNATLSEFTLTRNSLRKFWIQPTLKRLLP